MIDRYFLEPFEMLSIIRGLNNFPSSLSGGAVTIGNFDGIHLGHRALLGRLKQVAEQVGGPAMVLTFDPPPGKLLRPELVPPALTWMERRAEILEGLGIDALIVCNTTWELLQLSPEAFFDQVLRQQLQLRGLVEGPNFRFGKDRRGDVEMLLSLCDQQDIRLSIASAQSEDGEWISSSRIRLLIREGDLKKANRLLVEPYRLMGQVARGSARGRQLGFPTANLVDIPVLIPSSGVYAGVAIVSGERFSSAVHIGPNPTFGEESQKVEVHLLDFDGDLYGHKVEVELWEQLRGVQKFSGVEQLLDQLRVDITKTRSMTRDRILELDRPPTSNEPNVN
jgi:riboflavin kinase / FMN adenylyltransferase